MRLEFFCELLLVFFQIFLYWTCIISFWDFWLNLNIILNGKFIVLEILLSTWWLTIGRSSYLFNHFVSRRLIRLNLLEFLAFYACLSYFLMLLNYLRIWWCLKVVSTRIFLFLKHCLIQDHRRLETNDGHLSYSFILCLLAFNFLTHLIFNFLILVSLMFSMLLFMQFWICKVEFVFTNTLSSLFIHQSWVILDHVILFNLNVFGVVFYLFNILVNLLDILNIENTTLIILFLVILFQHWVFKIFFGLLSCGQSSKIHWFM